jgi:hypothetical protein
LTCGCMLLLLLVQDLDVIIDVGGVYDPTGHR